MVPLVMLSVIHAMAQPSGEMLGRVAIPHLVNKRWRTVPSSTEHFDRVYEWELQCKTCVPGLPMTLKIFTEDGVEISRKARCPAFLPNYISLESPNLVGVDEIFRDNTVYYLDGTTCILQNTWFTGASESKAHGPYFLSADIPTMRSVLAVRDTQSILWDHVYLLPVLINKCTQQSPDISSVSRTATGTNALLFCSFVCLFGLYFFMT